jgi:hypothetical protein
VGADQSSNVAAATERLRASTSVADLLGRTAESYVKVFDAPACTISRVIGELLVDLVQHRRQGPPDRLGHGYLISDYPLTRTVIETLEPKTVHSGDANADEAEVRLLTELGFDSLLMLAIRAPEGAWGLVEVYGNGRRFGATDVDTGRKLSDEAADVLLRLSRPVQ